MDRDQQGSPRHVIQLVDIVQRLRRFGLLMSESGGNPAIRGIADDSRRVVPGDLFCAWAGVAIDSHGFVPAAERSGAVAAMVERLVEDVRVPQVVVRDGRRAAAVAAAVVFGDPQDRLVFAGVTGTNGKTTTVWLLRHVLGIRYPAASLGTLGVILPDGSVLPDVAALTTPGPVELAGTLRTLVERGVDAVAMEVSSHALDQGRVHTLRFDAAVFTNLSRDHLDYHGTLEAYLTAKLALLGLLKPTGATVLNADEEAWKQMGSGSARVLRYGFDPAADVRAVNVQLDGDGARFDCLAGGERVPMRLPLLGAFNVQNALAATTAGLALDLPLRQIAARLATVSQVPGRLERIAATPCPVLRDYAHTPAALESALATLRPLTAGRLIVVFGAGGDRDRGKRPLMGTVAEVGADLAVVTSDNPRTEDPDAIIGDIVAGMHGRDYLRITDRRQAIARALELARPDDIVLLAGKGHEDYQIVGKEKRPFDERLVVSELLDSGLGRS